MIMYSAALASGSPHPIFQNRRSEPVQAIDALIRTHASLVRRIAWHVYGSVSTAIDREDLVQTGLVALIEAAKTFEDRGFGFAPYASIRIRGAMIDELRRIASISRSGMGARKAIAKARTALESRLCRTASNVELAAELQVDAKTFAAMAQNAQGAERESIDDCYSDHDLWFADLAETADAQVEKAQLRTRLVSAISMLPERQAMVLQLYFVEELNLHEIGEMFGVGVARVCQIKKAALDTLRLELEGED
jgi:RNA polymerase sigma factor FliA